MPSSIKEASKEGNRHDSAWVEMNQVERRPRFQVNRVDGAEGDDDERNRLCDDDDDHIGSYAKSFRHFTREALPRLDHYRNLTSMIAGGRPTLDELHNEFIHGKNFPVARMDGKGSVDHGEGVVKFGWIKGVLVRNLLNIWGVMLFLRLSWVVGQAGIWQGVTLILSTSVVTILTALSMSAISTNGVIKGGGTYFMISRSLGPEFGASIGLIFALANAVACAMYTVGFCESLLDLLATFDLYIVDGKVQDTRIIGSITILCLLGIVVIGMEWEAKTQVGLLFILLIAIVDFLIGAIMGPRSEEVKAKGFLGFNIDCLVNNFPPDFRLSQNVHHDFFSVFAVFFPAASGFLAGANISGDLKDPQVAIPKGTILSVILTTFSYVLMAVISGATVVRDASGSVEEFHNGNFTSCSDRECKFGLQNSFQVMELVSAFGPLIYAGCFAATLSSALASLVSAPKVFQALCKDNLYPYIHIFGKGYGKTGEPVRGYILTFFIALIFILVGELNAIAPLISNFFLAAYALINYSTFHSSLVRPVGWRPSFRYYNMWLSLVGAILCVGVMFLISWWTALITLSAVLALYLIVAYRAPDVNWGSSTQAQTYKNALTAVQSLSHVGDHVKNYRPQILVLTGMPHHRTPLVDFAHLITKNGSLLMCGNIVKTSLPQDRRNGMYYKAQSWLFESKLKAFYVHIEDTDFEHGAHSLMQVTGLGKLRPNILMLGYKSDWKTCDQNELAMYFNVIHKALDIYMAVAILRLQEGLNYSDMFEKDDCENIDANGPASNLNRQTSHESLTRNTSYNQMSRVSSISELSVPSTPQIRSARINDNPNPNGDGESPNKNAQAEKERGSNDFNKMSQLKGSENRNTNEDGTPVAKSTPKAEKDVSSSGVPSRNASSSQLSEVELNNLLRFQMKQKKGVIDVWWLYDDGGLTLLLPYIINTRRSWSQCKLRVFTLANKKDDLLYEKRSMASLLSKFRIDYSDLKVIPDITKKPQEETLQLFESIIKDFVVDEENEVEGVHISKAEMGAMKDKTNRHLRLRELLLEHSTNANLIVMTLPMPRKNITTACLYMAWLEMLTKDMPPFLLVRGNQQSVLTFNS